MIQNTGGEQNEHGCKEGDKVQNADTGNVYLVILQEMGVKNTRRNVIQEIFHKRVDQKTDTSLGLGIAEIIYPTELCKRRFHDKDHPTYRLILLESSNYT
jgi:hypothetical protein